MSILDIPSPSVSPEPAETAFMVPPEPLSQKKASRKRKKPTGTPIKGEKDENEMGVTPRKKRKVASWRLAPLADPPSSWDGRASVRNKQLTVRQ